MNVINARVVIDCLPTPVIVCDAKGAILLCNGSAETIFGLDDTASQSISRIMPEANWKAALRGETVVIIRNSVPIPIYLHKEKTQYILHTDLTETSFAIRRDFFHKHEHTSELSELFDIYMDENIWVTDGNGKTIFVSAAVAGKHGVPQDKMLGRYVQDLEKERVFHPSVTMEVIRTHRQSVVLQHTIDGRFCVSVGIPTFDSEGNIERIISITRDCENQLEVGRTLALDEPSQTPLDPDGIFGLRFASRNKDMNKMLQVAKLSASTDSTILIEGESGVGKSLLARIIHDASSRSGGPFLTVNCAVIDEKLFESEMFGYVSGSFTGADARGKAGLLEMAQGGTLFLDEIEEMSLAQQVKLLEVIQGRSIKRVGGTERIPLNVRIICAAKNSLAGLVAASKFRMDLFYRLNVVTLIIPPLRARKEDIPHLARHITAQINRDYGLNKQFAQAAIEKLHHYDYPGNVRELAHVIEQSMVMTSNRTIEVPDLPEKIRQDHDCEDEDVVVPCIMPLALAIEQAEECLLRLALQKHNKKKSIMAELQVSQATLWRKLQRYGLHQNLD